MESSDLAAIIAEYLNDRDDIAKAEVGDGSQVVVETQGGTMFSVEIGPSYTRGE